MYAIIKTGGKQYKVAAGDVLDVELLGAEQGAAVEFADVLLVYDGQQHKIGDPCLPEFTVKGEIVGATAGPKCQSVKYKQRKRQDRKFGHRQHYQRVLIKEIARS